MKLVRLDDNGAGEPTETFECGFCGRVLPMSEFLGDDYGYGRVIPLCRDCRGGPPTAFSRKPQEKRRGWRNRDAARDE